MSTYLTVEQQVNVIDFSERKLVRLAAKHPDESVRKLAARMLHDYVKGLITVAWEDNGSPVYSFVKL